MTFLLTAPGQAIGQEAVELKKKDRKKDVLMVTTKGNITLRLSDSTPLHRDNFLKLVKLHYYDSITFHRIIRQFMIQAGDPKTKSPFPGKVQGEGDPGYTIPAEFRPGLFHKRGALAAARKGDDVNPEKASSGSQFYIVQGRQFTDTGLDSVETFRLNGRKIPEGHRTVYKTIGGAPHLDQGYTVFGEVVSGLEIVDLIASVPTSGKSGGDKPLEDIRIVEMKLIRRAKR
jgi:peptidyl-prolyl cis-trans isomerase B (cyclophilin B)